MKRKLSATLLLIVGLVCLQQLLVIINQSTPSVSTQIQQIKDQDMEPSSMFYTESEHALSAEKTIRKAVNQ